MFSPSVRVVEEPQRINKAQVRDNEKCGPPDWKVMEPECVTLYYFVRVQDGIFSARGADAGSTHSAQFVAAKMGAVR